MEKTKLNSLALGYTAAILAAIVMFLLGILGNIGVYTSAVEAMQQWHVFFSLSFGGIIAGMAEGAAASFILVYLFALIYNKLA